MQEQNKMFEAKKEEAAKKHVATVGESEPEEKGESLADDKRINVMNIDVEENFEIDDI